MKTERGRVKRTNASGFSCEPCAKRLTLLLATDRSGSIISETIGTQTNTLGYCAYGHQSAQYGAEGRLGFNGQLREEHIGWYLLGNGYRAYNPCLMRFHSPDSWSPFGRGGLNPYMYGIGDPVNHRDPSGHSVLGALRIAVEELIFSKATLAARRTKKVYRLQAMSSLYAAGGKRTPKPRPPVSDAVSDIFGYFAGAPLVKGNSPQLEYVAELKNFPGYDSASRFSMVTGANQMGGSESRIVGTSTTASTLKEMELWNANTFATGGHTTKAYPVETGPAPPGKTSGSFVNPQLNPRPVFGETHAIAEGRPTAVVKVFRQNPVAAQPNARSRSSSSSGSSTSRDSTPPQSRRPTPPINWQPLTR